MLDNGSKEPRRAVKANTKLEFCYDKQKYLNRKFKI